MMKKTLIALMSILVAVNVTGCVKVPKLDNGKEVVAELNGKQITANDLYDSMRDKYGFSSLMTLVDNFIISQELENTDNEEAEAKAYVKQMKEYYVNSGQDWNNVLSSNGFTEESLIELYTTDNATKSVAEKYYRDSVTDEEINKFYEEDIIGDITAKQILISSKASSSASDEEKKAAEEVAYNKAKEVISKLNEGADFTELAKEYSDDKSASEGGTLAPFNKQSNYSKEFLDDAISLNPGEYSKNPVKSEYGYHIILIVSKADKPSLEDSKDNIITYISEDKIEANSDYVNVAWKALREKYNLSIYDTVIDERYKTAVSNY